MSQLSNRCLNAAIVVMLTATALWMYPRSLAADTSSESDVKAAFVLNFARFVEWPEAAFADRSAPLTLAIAGADPFGGQLERLVHDKTINAHPLIVRQTSATADFKGVNVLFVSASERQRTPVILKALVGASVLTVSDVEDFCSMGGIIQLKNQEQRIRFDVNLFAAQHAGLTVSSKLLGLARTVYTEKGSQ